MTGSVRDTLPGLPDAYEACATARHSANADLERLRRDLARHLPGWSISASLLDGRPETALCRVTRPEDLLVVGASGLTWGSGDVLGSVAETVAATAVCPVLVHRSPSLLGLRRSAVVVGVDGSSGSPAFHTPSTAPACASTAARPGSA